MNHMGAMRFEERAGQPVMGTTRRRLAGLLAGVAVLGSNLVRDEAGAKGKKGKGKKGKKKKTKVNPFKDIAITGDALGGETFAGKVTIASFRADGAQVLARGTLTGTVTKGDGATEAIPATQVEFPYDGAAPGRQRGVDAQSGASGSIYVSIGFLIVSLLSIEFTLNSFFLQPKIGKSKARVKAVNELMTADTPQARAAALNKLRGTYPA